MADLPHLNVRQIIGERSLFVTRWWGFRPDSWGAVLFSEEAIVNRWLNDCPQGGFVLGFASHNPQEQIEPADQGRVLGVYEFAPEKIRATDPEAIDPAWLNDARLQNASGRFRWPFGFKAVRAWRFIKSNVMTRGSLPDARRKGFILTRDMAPITGTDLNLIDQYLLEETPVYRRPFQPLRLTDPNAVPDRNYLLVCRDISMLRRIPLWRAGDILYKPGIASDIDARLGGHNNHAIAKLFGLKLEEVWRSGTCTTELARAREREMIYVCEQRCRLAAEGQREFFLGPEADLHHFIAAAGGATRVA